MNKNLTLKALTVATLMLGAAAPASAADNLAVRFATGLGHAVASQGNAAFQQIRADLRQELARQFEAWLPTAAPVGSYDAEHPSAGLDELVEWHEQARAETSAVQ